MYFDYVPNLIKLNFQNVNINVLPNGFFVFAMSGIFGFKLYQLNSNDLRNAFVCSKLT